LPDYVLRAALSPVARQDVRAGLICVGVAALPQPVARAPGSVCRSRCRSPSGPAGCRGRTGRYHHPGPIE